jgi:hypothetical protein
MCTFLSLTPPKILIATLSILILVLKSVLIVSTTYLAIFVCTTGRDNVIASTSKSKTKPIRVLDTIFFSLLITAILLFLIKFNLNRQRTTVLIKIL